MSGVALLWLGACVQVWAVPALQEVRVNPLLADQLLLEAKSRLNQPAAGRDNKTGTDHNSVVTVP